MIDLTTDILNAVDVQLANAASNASSVIYNLPFAYGFNEEASFPHITYAVVSAPKFYSNGANNGTTPYKYATMRLRFNIFYSSDDLVKGRSITDAVMALFSWCTLNTQHHFMGAYPADENQIFFEDDNKVWHDVVDFRVYIGD
jgi:hypothetical protein